MASHTKGRHEWNAVMKDTYGIKVVNKYAQKFKRTTRGVVEKRQSSRVRKISKALLNMNAEERRSIEDERMNALELDNAKEDKDEDDSDFSEEEEEPPQKRRRGTRNRNPGKGKVKGKKNATAKKKVPKKIPFELLLSDEQFRRAYTNANTKEPKKPRRRFCPVTGMPAIYRDPVTRTPYSTKEAFEQIREKKPSVLLR